MLGSANMDLIAYVPVAAARGETVLGREFRTVPGGKGANQAIAATRAGAEVRMIGAVGSDAFGAELRRTLAASGVDTELLRTVAGPTGTARSRPWSASTNWCRPVAGARPSASATASTPANDAVKP